VRNVRRNRKVSLLIESGSSMSDIKGLLIQGNAELITEPARTLPLLQEASRRRGVPEEQLPREPRPGLAYIRVRPQRFISWDYSR
jgi:hypothetical protein